MGKQLEWSVRVAWGQDRQSQIWAREIKKCIHKYEDYATNKLTEQHPTQKHAERPLNLEKHRVSQNRESFLVFGQGFGVSEIPITFSSQSKCSLLF